MARRLGNVLFWLGALASFAAPANAAILDKIFGPKAVDLPFRWNVARWKAIPAKTSTIRRILPLRC